MESSPRFVPVADVADLDRGPKVVRVEGRQLALFRAEDRFYAVDNRCPHMGYPLSMGTVRGETLTCDWHNWKFRLEDGACILRGSEDVRSYAVRVEGGRILADLSDPPVEELMAKHLTNLKRGLKRFDAGGMARDAVRLMTLGMAPAEVMRQGALHNAEREEFGWGHALAVIADCADMMEFYDGDSRAIPVVNALWAASEPVEYFRVRPHGDPEPADREGEAEFRRRIEAEDVDGAEGWLRGALEGGLGERELSRWLVNAASDHFLGFGHQAIYVHKAHQFADHTGWAGLAPIIPSIVPSIAWATRYDRLPEMRKYIARLRAIEDLLPAIARLQRGAPGRFEPERFRDDVLFGKGDAAFEAVHGALAAGVAADAVARELVLAASERLLRMDLEWETSHDERVWDEGGWLEITHLLTHANANRQLLRRQGVSAEALRGLYHSAWFINYQKRFDRTDGVRADAGPLPEPHGESAAELAAEYREDVAGKRPEDAMGVVARWTNLGLPTSDLLRSMAHEAMEVNDGDFISMAHVLKTTHAAIEEHRSTAGHPGAGLPLMAATRYISSPRRQRAVYDAALNSVKFIRSGAARSVQA